MPLLTPHSAVQIRFHSVLVRRWSPRAVQEGVGCVGGGSSAGVSEGSRIERRFPTEEGVFPLDHERIDRREVAQDQVGRKGALLLVRRSGRDLGLAWIEQAASDHAPFSFGTMRRQSI